VVLRAPVVVVARGEVADGVEKYSGPEVPVEVTIGSRSGAFVGFKQLDLTGVSAIVFAAAAPVPNVNSAGGKVEVRLDSASGVLVGETEMIQPQAAMVAPSRLRAALTRTSGMRDVYFVFRNDEAKEGQNLFVLFTAAFERGTGSR
jgi:cytochrome c